MALKIAITVVTILVVYVIAFGINALYGILTEVSTVEAILIGLVSAIIADRAVD